MRPVLCYFCGETKDHAFVGVKGAFICWDCINEYYEQMNEELGEQILRNFERNTK